MVNNGNLISRLLFLKQSSAASLGILLSDSFSSFHQSKMIMRQIPSSGETIPAIGLGSWITFDVGDSVDELAPMRDVLKAFVDAGGKVIDSSPMYGRSEKVIGRLAAELNFTNKLWFATKVWTSSEESGKKQIENSKNLFKKWPTLLQVHNLQDVKTHLKTLRSFKEEGKLKYIGITHYLDSEHDELAALVKSEKLDFIQVNLSIRNTAAEHYLIPLAAEKGVGVIINRPFESGALFQAIKKNSLPSWAKEWGITTWAAFFLKYIISNTNVTCTIPATSQVSHLKENMVACFEPLPDAAARKKMADYIADNV
ncbi:MAG TPA: aldo/keto reductase [Chitinophagaceae bacterium]|nr:aldo/keto reductase [Chitinophagaceae bacterium]